VQAHIFARIPRYRYTYVCAHTQVQLHTFLLAYLGMPRCIPRGKGGNAALQIAHHHFNFWILDGHMYTPAFSFGIKSSTHPGSMGQVGSRFEELAVRAAIADAS